MSEIYLMTGRLGSGKTLGAVNLARDYAESGRRVVSNFHLDLAPISKRGDSKLAKTSVLVIPARPTSEDLLSLGRGGNGEHDAGLLILDECGTMLNARQWNGKDRQSVIEWFLHARKLAWDVLLIVQHQNMLDKQIREAIVEKLVICRRLDKIRVPILHWIMPFLKLPRLHMCQVRYGLSPNDPVSDTWVFRGNSLFACYDTKWMSVADGEGSYCVLPATLSKHRYATRKRSGNPFGMVIRIVLYAYLRALVAIGALSARQFQACFSARSGKLTGHPVRVSRSDTPTVAA